MAGFLKGITLLLHATLRDLQHFLIIERYNKDMKYFSEKNIIEKISNREVFNATVEGGAFTLHIRKYEPALSVAIHNGGRFPDDLAENCLLFKTERYFEEDPYTGNFIASQAITIVAHDSRYEYDLNRKKEDCVYETAWGKEVWKNPLSDVTLDKCKKKHAQFYRILYAVIEALREDYGQCIVYDIHSYNYQRHERKDLPVFNLGTSSVTNTTWQPVIADWLESLRGIHVENVETTVAENDIFHGKGFLATTSHSRYKNVLVLATEVKKVFMNELTGKADPLILPQLQQEFNAAIEVNTKLYTSKLINTL